MNSLIKRKNILLFAASRFLRIVPPLFFVLFLTAFFFGPLISSYSVKQYFSNPELFGYILKPLTLVIQYNLPGVFTDNNYKIAVNGSLWSIPVEIKAYIYLAMVYIVSLIFGKYKNYFMLSITIIVILSPFVKFSPMTFAAYDDLNSLFLYPLFAMGCLFSLLKDKLHINAIAGISILFFISYFISSNYSNRVFFFSAGVAMFSLYIASLPLLKKIALKFDISYGVYIWAFPVQQLMSSFIPNSPYINMFTSILVVTPLAYISRILIENPCLHLNKKFQCYYLKVSQYRVSKVA